MIKIISSWCPTYNIICLCELNRKMFEMFHVLPLVEWTWFAPLILESNIVTDRDSPTHL